MQHRLYHACGVEPLGAAASPSAAMRCCAGRRMACCTSSSGAPATVAITDSRRRSLPTMSWP